MTLFIPLRHRRYVRHKYVKSVTWRGIEMVCQWTYSRDEAMSVTAEWVFLNQKFLPRGVKAEVN